jgi:hypothetical protein
MASFLSNGFFVGVVSSRCALVPVMQKSGTLDVTKMGTKMGTEKRHDWVQLGTNRVNRVLSRVHMGTIGYIMGYNWVQSWVQQPGYKG